MKARQVEEVKVSVAVVPRHATDVRPPAPAMGYIPGLDGIRAIAVMAVLLYHSGVVAVPGGFLGVDVFFVLSGFLISSLLLQEIERAEAVNFKQFYIRRARRLLPALFATLALSAVLVLIFARDAAFQFRQDAIASFFYVGNWWYIVQDLSYFEAMGRPPVLQHLWSLAVEEQFYLLWPLALVFLYRRGGRPGVGRVALMIALFSTLLMAVFSFLWNVPASGDASRLYFGTDTHCMGLLLGAALATVWRPGALPKKIALPAQVILWVVALVSLVGLFTIFHKAAEDSAWLYRGGCGDHRLGLPPGDRFREDAGYPADEVHRGEVLRAVSVPLADLRDHPSRHRSPLRWPAGVDPAHGLDVRCG